MGNKNNNETRSINTQHVEELERIRNIHDENQQKILLDKKIAEYNYENKRREIERLIKMDELDFKKEMERLGVERRKNDQLNEEETTISNNQQEKMKGLDNDEKKIDNEFKLTTCKFDDDKEINNIKENNIFINERDKMKLDFENECKKRENEELDIIRKRNDERMRDQEIYENRKMELEYNNKYNMQDIYAQRRRDEMEDRRLTDQINKEDKRETQRINNNYLLNKQQIDDNYILRSTEINNNFIIKEKKIKIEEEKNKQKFENERRAIEIKDKINEKLFKIEIEKIKANQKMQEKKLDIEKERYENDANRKHELDKEEAKYRGTQMQLQHIEVIKNMIMIKRFN